MEDDDEVKKKAEHEIGDNLDDISIDELKDRIKLLEDEMERIRKIIKQKQESHKRAEEIFKL